MQRGKCAGGSGHRAVSWFADREPRWREAGVMPVAAQGLEGVCVRRPE